MNAGEQGSTIALAAADPQPRRVLVTADTVGGVWSYAIELCRRMAREGSAILLAGIGPELSAAAARQVAAMPEVQFEYLQAKLEWMSDPWHDIARTKDWLLDLELGFQPDLVHLNQNCYADAGFKAPTLVVAHSCVYSWFESVRGAAPGPEWEPYRAAVKTGIAAADGVTAVSETLLDGLSNWYGSYRRLPMIANGLEPRSLNAESPEKKPFILSAGRIWDEAKNIALLDTIADEVPWPIRVAGSAMSPENGDKAELPRVELLGSLEQAQLAKLMDEASIYAAPAFYEPFGLAILEAARSGCALVLADIPSLVRLWEGAALFVSPRNPHSWANALSQLIEDDAMRAHLGELARQRSRASAFSANSMTQAYSKLYDELIADARPVKTDKIA